jgi:hypothetical protein
MCTALFGYLERMNEERLVKRVWKSEVEGSRPRGRPCFSWMNGVQKALRMRDLTVEDARECARDRSAWSMIVNRRVMQAGGADALAMLAASEVRQLV